MDRVSRATIRLSPEPSLQPPRSRRPWRFLVPIITFLLGLMLGVLAVVLYLFSISGNGHVLSTPLPPQASDITVQVGPVYITHLLEKDLRASGLTNVSNVRVTLATGDQLTIDADDQIFFGVTRHFTIVVQPVIEDCQLKMHILHADLAGITVTGFVTSFESQIDQQLQSNPSNLPKGFTYCKTSVHTDPHGLYITFSATPS